jgi:hypothetical protein
MLEQVRQSVGVENIEKRLECIFEDPRQAAGSSYHTQVTGSEAFDWAEGTFHVPDYRAKADLFGRSGQGETAALASLSLDETCASETMHDLHQVIAGDAIMLGNFGD